MRKVLIIDDDQALSRSIQLIMSTKGYAVSLAPTAEIGLSLMKDQRADLILLDLGLPDADGLEVLKEFVQHYPEHPVIVISGRQDMAATITAMRNGAHDYLRKPFDVDDVEIILEKLKREYRQKNAPTSVKSPPEPLPALPHEIIGNHPSIIEILKQIGRLSRSQVSVLIQGDSGTGKELVARAIHNASAGDQSFIAINCSAIVSTLLESELFGHEKGAFTGADRQKTGKLEQVGRGTVFFDEIGDMDLDLQAKLLRVLQEKNFERVGGNQLIPFRGRPVFATHRNLAEMVKEGTFREDLYYRVVVGELLMPSLRERTSDIPLLAQHFLRVIGRKLGRAVEKVSPEAMELLVAHDWPGNVRELENVMTRAIVLTETSVLLPEHINFLGGASSVCATVEKVERLNRSLAEVEKEYIEQVLRDQDWNITHSARILDISPTTLRKKISDYGLQS